MDEVLVAWCGSMPKRLLEVIHGGTGEFIRMLDPTVPVLASSHRRQISVKAINHQFLNHGVAIVSVVVHTVFHFTVNFLFVIFCVYYVCFCGVNVGVEFMCFA